VAATATVGATVFSLILYGQGTGPPTPAFPLAHVLVLIALLGSPRVAYRWLRARGGEAEANTMPVLAAGNTEDCDLFLRALANDPRHRFRVEGLLTFGTRNAGRRIQGCPIIGDMTDADASLARLRDESRLPGTLVIVTPDLGRAEVSAVVALADRFGLRVR